MVQSVINNLDINNKDLNPSKHSIRPQLFVAPISPSVANFSPLSVATANRHIVYRHSSEAGA